MTHLLIQLGIVGVIHMVICRLLNQGEVFVEWYHTDDIKSKVRHIWLLYLDELEPKNMQEALNTPNRDECLKAIDEEL